MARNVRCLMTLMLLSLLLRAGQTAAAGPVRTVQLQLSPQPEPQYALQYLLETPYMEQRPGNGALQYQAAAAQMVQINSGDEVIDRDELRQWRNSSVESLPLEKVRATLARFQPAFRYLDLASRCERCTWELAVREDSFGYMVPYLSDYRMLAELLMIKIRLEAHDGDYDKALETLKAGFSLARDVGGGPSLIQNLVGVAIGARMAREMETVIQAPGAPNLYWALTALPRPLINMRPSLQMECAALYSEFPELLTLEENVLPNEQVMAVWKRTTTVLGPAFDRPGAWLDKVAEVATAMKAYPEAKAHLLERGRSVEEVESWPALYVVLLEQHHQYRVLRDMHYKWSQVPYWQARDGLKQSSAALSKYFGKEGLAKPFVFLLPALERVHFLNARLERDIAMLRCTEAIRIYAAEHNGKLPSSLAEITSVPVPLDPIFGHSFSYHATGKKAVLESTSPVEVHKADGQRYEITIR